MRKLRASKIAVIILVSFRFCHEALSGECYLRALPNVPYRNPVGTSTAFATNVAPGNFENVGFDTNLLLFPYESSIPAYGLAREIERLAATNFPNMPSPWMVNLAGIVTNFCDHQLDGKTRESKWAELERAFGTKQAGAFKQIKLLVTEMLSRKFVAKVLAGHAKWKDAVPFKPTNQGSEDGIYWSYSVLTNHGKTIKVQEAATLVFLDAYTDGRPSVPDYLSAIERLMGVDRDAQGLPQWIGLEYSYTTNSFVQFGTCWRWQDGRGAFWQIHYEASNAPSEFRQMSARYFDRLDSRGHKLTDGYAYTSDKLKGFTESLNSGTDDFDSGAAFLWRDTFIPLCDGSGQFIAVIAVDQLTFLGKPSHRYRACRQTALENLSNLRDRAERGITASPTSGR